MSKAIKVRFLNNFIITVVQTILSDDERLEIQENQFHIAAGDTYMLSQYEERGDNRYDLHFVDESPLAGVAHNIEGDYVELRHTPAEPKTVVSKGCGGCGKKKKR